MDLRYFELHDLLCEALIALDAGDLPAASAALRKAVAWAEHDWLATPSVLPGRGAWPAPAGDDPDDGDDE